MARHSTSLFAALSLICAVAGAKEAPQPLTDTAADRIAAEAPACPAKLELGLKTRLIDFIDCGDAKDPHGFKDQGTSWIVIGPAGKYRVTAAHRHAFFAYRFRSAGKDRPVLIVFEYPDDADRTINFSTHESGLSGRANSDWSLETGVYTGEPFPLSKKMQYHTFIWYPRDQWPCAIVSNFHRYGNPAAASRIWVYAITKPLPKLKINVPDAAKQRRLGHYNSFGSLPTRLHFGLRSPKAVDRMLDYCDFIGLNELSWTVIANNSWGTWCTIPSWDRSGGEPTHLDKVLAAMDARGGFHFTAAFGPEGNYKMGGKGYQDMTPDELKAATIKGFDEFLDRYGKYNSLKAIALGGQYGAHFFNVLNEKGVAADVVKHIKAKRPDIQVLTYIGGRGLHIEYFDGGKNKATANDVITRFEASKQHWSDFLGDQALSAWKQWKIDPATVRKAGLEISEQYQPDDNRIFDLYAQQPRSLIYHDLDCSQRRSDHIASPYANLWNTHYEGWFGLNPQVNFWYKKHWVAPDFNPPPPLSLAPLSRVMGHRDRLGIVAGSWNNRFFGHESAIRRFSRAYRALPPVLMKEISTGTDTVKARWVDYKGKQYVSVLNRTPFAATVKVDGKAVDLPPFELVAVAGAKAGRPVVAGKTNPAYVKWIGGRIAKLEALHAEVKALNAKAAPDVYLKAAAAATAHLAAGRAYAAEQTLGAGLIGEMRLRKEILSPPELIAPRIGQVPKMTGDLDAWPKAAGDVTADSGEYLAGHLYFPNSWTGPKDLSARLRLAHDGKMLYVGVEVRDSVVAKYDDPWNRRNKTFKRADSCGVRLSTDGKYLDWIAPEGLKSNVTWPIAVPFKDGVIKGQGPYGFGYICRKTDTGYVFEGVVKLAKLNVEPGGSIGFLLSVSDVDKTRNIKEAGWAAKQVLMVPHRPNYRYWDDVRNCGRLRLGK